MTEPVAATRSAWWRRFGFVLGVVLLVAAIVAVARRYSEVQVALSAIRAPSWPHVAALLGVVIANLVLTGFFFTVLMRRFGRVGLLEMQAVMGAATLLNYLPVSYTHLTLPTTLSG